MYRPIGIALSMLVLAGCDTVPLLAPTGSTVTLHVNAANLSSNGSAEVMATVIESSGTAVQDGTLVRFTSTIGQLDPPEARTNGGNATVRLLLNGASGVATISAFSGGASVETAVELRFGTAAVETLSLTATPGSLPATGGTVTIMATVIDVDGRPVSGVPVTFSATQGALNASVATTNAEGQASVTLTTGAESVVTANAGGKSATLTVGSRAAAGFTFTPPTAAPLEDTPTTITITPSPTGAAIRDVVVDFGDGRSVQLGTLTGATVVGHTYSSSGTFILRASGVDSFGGAVTGATAIVVAERALIPITITTSTATMGGSGALPLNGITTITVAVTPTTGTTVNNVSLDFGDGDSANLGGTGTTVSTQHVYRRAGPVTIRATVTDAFGGKSTASIERIVQ